MKNSKIKILNVKIKLWIARLCVLVFLLFPGQSFALSFNDFSTQFSLENTTKEFTSLFVNYHKNVIKPAGEMTKDILDLYVNDLLKPVAKETKKVIKKTNQKTNEVFGFYKKNILTPLGEDIVLTLEDSKKNLSEFSEFIQNDTNKKITAVSGLATAIEVVNKKTAIQNTTKDITTDIAKNLASATENTKEDFVNLFVDYNDQVIKTAGEITKEAFSPYGKNILKPAGQEVFALVDDYQNNLDQFSVLVKEGLNANKPRGAQSASVINAKNLKNKKVATQTNSKTITTDSTSKTSSQNSQPIKKVAVVSQTSNVKNSPVTVLNNQAPTITDSQLFTALEKLFNKKVPDNVIAKLKGEKGDQGLQGPQGVSGSSAMYPMQPVYNIAPSAPSPLPSVFIPGGIAQSNSSANFSGATLLSATDLSATSFISNTANITNLTVTQNTTLSGLSINGNLTVSGTVTGVLPTQTGNSGKYLTTDGMTASWGTVASGGAWGSITGTLSSQTDLQSALDLKANLASPTLVTPVLGVATATSINGMTLTSSTGVFTLTNAKTFSVSNTLTLAGTDGSTLNVGTGGTLGTNAYTSTAYAPLASPTFTGTVTIPTPFTLGATSVTSTGTQLNYLASATGTTGTTSTNLVFSTSPTLVTPALGTPTALVLTNATGLPAASVLAGTFGTGAYVMDTSLSVPSIVTASGALGITPAAGSNLNLNLSTTGDFAVNTNQLYVDTSAGFVGIGTTTPNNILDVGPVSSSNGLAINSGTSGTGSLYFYDGSNDGAIQYSHATRAMNFNVAGTSSVVSISSAGLVNIPGALTVAGVTTLTGSIITNATATNGTFYNTHGTSGANLTVSQYIIGGASGTLIRTGFYGSGSSTPTTNYNYSAVTIGSAPLTTQASGTHAILANLGVKAIGTVTAGGAAITNTATVYVEGASSAGTNNYALWVDDGTVRFDGNVGIGTTSPTAVLHLKAGTTSASSAPLKFTSGSLNTTAEAGAVEFLTDAFYGTITTGAARKTFAFLESPSFTTPALGSATSTGLALTSANTTEVTTASALALNANSLTTGTGFYAASSTLTSGLLMDLQVSGTAAAASQTALNILTAGANATNAITTYGAQISNTHTNATSGTNVALYLNASGATTANYGLIVNAGRVGIGTTAPTGAVQISATSGDGLILTRSDVATQSISLIPNDGTYSALIKGGGNSKPFYIASTGAYPLYFGSNYTSGLSEVRMTIGATGDVGIGATTPSSKLDVTTAGLGTTQADTSGISLVNTTAATSGNQQISPGLRWRGYGWKTTSTAASQSVDFRAYVLPVQASSAPTANWVLQAAINGGAYADEITVKSGTGAVTFGSNSSNFIGASSDNSTNATGGVTMLYKGHATGTNNVFSHAFISSTRSGTTGTIGMMKLTQSWTPSATSTANYNGLSVNYTIDAAAGAASGTGTGILVNATETSLNGLTHNLLDLQVASTSKFKVTNAGFVGIAQTTPAIQLHVGSSSITDATSLLRLQDANSTCDFTADSGSPSCGSDLSLKKDVNSLSPNELLTRVASLNPVSYRWLTDTDDSKLQYGFIAQEVAIQFPDLVTDHTWIDGTTRKFLNTGGLMPYVIGAVKELNTKIASLNDTIKSYLSDAENGIEDLFARKIHTKELCVGDESGAETCITKAQLDTLLGGANIQANVNNNSGDTVADESTDNTTNNTTDTTPDNSDPTVGEVIIEMPTITETQVDTNTNTENTSDTPIVNLDPIPNAGSIEENVVEPEL